MKTLVLAATPLLRAPAADMQPPTVASFDRSFRDEKARMDAPHGEGELYSNSQQCARLSQARRSTW